jgi:RNA polymerase sigma-70 factor (ECF subfamily)
VKRPRNSGGETPGERVSEALLQRCRDGDESAWTELVDATYREVYALCLRILRNPDDAAEATQDAYLKAWRGLARFRGDSAFTTWLYRIAANAAISRHRSRQRRRSRESDVGEDGLADIASPASTEDSASARMDLRELERAVASLPELYRLPLVMRDVYGLSTDEVAQELKISETATKVRIHRARKMLKSQMFDQTEEEER